MGRSRSLRWALGAVALGTCAGTEERTALDEEEVRTAMVDHWSDAVAARDALIAGSLPRARKAARRIATGLGDDPVPDAVAGARSEVVLRAERAAASGDLTTVAVAIGEMAWQCGSCHVAAQAVVDVQDAPIVADPEMARHQRAVQALWEGLLTHDDASLNSAAGQLADAPLAPSGGASALPPLANELERVVHELASGIPSSADVEKGTQFGHLLTTCATCHTLVRDPQ